MQRITTPTRAVDLFGPGKDGFTAGDPQAGVLATRLDAEWFNLVQEEVCSVIEAAGIPLDGDSRTQLLQSLQGLGLRSATAGQTGVVELATSAETASLADVERAVTPAGLGSLFGRSLAAAGYQRLPGGLIVQWASLNVANGTAITFPIAFPTAFLAITFGDYAGSGGQVYAQGAQDPSATGFVFRSTLTSGSDYAYYIALGY